MGDESSGPPPGGGTQQIGGKGSALNSDYRPQFSTTSPWVEGAVSGEPRRLRSFAEIVADQEKNRNILEIVLKKVEKLDSDGKPFKFRNLTFDEIGSFLFETLKISPSECERFNYTTGRYDTREVLFKPGVDLSPYSDSYEYLIHVYS